MTTTPRVARTLLVAFLAIFVSAFAAGQQIESVTATPNPVQVGESATGTIHLTKAASSKGLKINLTSSSVDAKVPASLIIASGATSATFAITIEHVTATIKATIKGTDPTNKSADATLTIDLPTVRLTGLSVAPTTVSSPDSAIGTVTLSTNAPTAGFVVDLSSSSTFVALPQNVTVKGGAKTATFTVETHPVTATSIATIIGADPNGYSATTKLTVDVPALRLKTLTVEPTSVTVPGKATATVTLTENAASGGFVITLASAQTYISIPSTVTVKAGAKTASFTVVTNPVATAGTATIKGTDPYGYQASASLVVKVPALRLVGVSVSPSAVTAANPAIATVTLSENAPTAGLVVSLATDQSYISVPATVTVKSGMKTATFTVVTNPVAIAGTATIKGTDPTAYSASAPLVVKVPAVRVIGVSVSPTSVSGGTSSTGTVTLSSAAPSAGFTVNLSTMQSFITLPLTVSVKGGATTGTFTIGTSSVTAASQATLSAADSNFYSASATLTVNPQSSGNIVNMTDTLTFTPKSLTVSAGATVTWSNISFMGHTVTPDVSTPGMDSDGQYPGAMPPGKTFSWTVPANAKSGTAYYYHCRIHGSAGNGKAYGTGMTGVIIVK